MFVADSESMSHIVNRLKNDKPIKNRKISQDSQQENDDRLALRRLEEIPEKR